tara:strand:- start:2578 stop:2952 length:375 start_codon:yes stop_codon:yes gene_type:complete
MKTPIPEEFDTAPAQWQSQCLVARIQRDEALRERDEARERVDTMFAKYADILEEARSERDEARGAMARLCRAVSRRMMPDEPTPEDTMELGEALDAASSILHNAAMDLPGDPNGPKTNSDVAAG